MVLGTPVVASATGAPTIKSFTVSPSSVSSAGGKVTLTAKVGRAKTCTFSFTPHVGGLPATLKCSSGSVAKTIEVPANASSSTKYYTVKLSVKGSVGNVSATKRISEAAFVWASRTIDPLQGAPDSVSCPTTTFCVSVDGTGNVVMYNGATWSSPRLIDPNPASEFGFYNPLNSVACPKTNFCVAVDNVGNVLTYNGTTWSSPRLIDPGAALMSVSCPTTTFCAAVDNSGNALTYNGRTWSGLSSIDAAELVSVSCHTATFCVALDPDGNALTYNGARWSLPTSVTTGILESVSCASTTFCAAVDYNGDAYTYNGKTWSAGVIPFGTAPLPDVLTAPAGAIAQYSALGRSGLKIEAGTGAEPEWSTLYTSNGLAASAAGRSCGAGSLTALTGSGVGELVGSDCRTPGVVGIFAGAGTPGSLELVGPTLVPSDGQFSVLRLSSQKNRFVALVDGRNGSVNDLYALSGDGQPSSWSVSRSLTLPAGGAVVSSGFGPDGSLVVETKSASGDLQGAVSATGSGGSWTRLPQLPAGTEGVSVAADGTVDALSADLSELTVWQLTVGRWIRSQVVIVPIQYGSSS